MAGCSLGKDASDNCRCRAVGEPDSLDCVYCGATFYRAWELMHHCHKDHGLTIYTIPSPSISPAASLSSASSGFSRRSQENSKLSDHRHNSNSKSIPKSENNSSKHSKLDSQSEGTHEASDWDPEEQDDEAIGEGDEEDSVDNDVQNRREQEQEQDTHRDHDSDEQARTPTLAENDEPIQLGATDQLHSPTDRLKLEQPKDEETISLPGLNSTKSQRATNGADSDLKTDRIGTTTVKSDSSPSHIRRSRRGEYGRHETIEDEDDYEEEEEDVLRPHVVEN